MMTRRTFLAATASAVVLGGTGPKTGAAQTAPATLPAVTQPKIPRWRGFNLLERFSSDWGPPKPFEERDFEATREWGFNFLRIPMDYRFWGSQKDYFEIREADLVEVDRVVELGKQYGLHINLNFHRAPGYCVNEPKEPTLLWEDEKAMDACAKHWAHFAARYKGRPSSELSFNLINEPGDKVKEADYECFARRMTAAIRQQDPDRLIVADGLKWGQAPAWGLWDLAVVQSGRGYGPFGLTHYKAGWIKGSDTWSVPTWPGDGWDKARLERDYIRPWQTYVQRGGAMHIGEFGCLNQTPHDVTLAWMTDLLGLWKQQGWGWALWNLRGGFGVADSDRKDVIYEAYKGMKLDRKMLDVLRAT
jgi:endoglucanase